MIKFQSLFHSQQRGHTSVQVLEYSAPFVPSLFFESGLEQGSVLIRVEAELGHLILTQAEASQEISVEF